MSREEKVKNYNESSEAFKLALKKMPLPQGVQHLTTRCTTENVVNVAKVSKPK